MTSQPKPYPLIIQYLNGELNFDESEKFKNEMRENPLFAEDVEDTRTSSLLIKASALVELRNQLKEYGKEMGTDKRKTVYLKRAKTSIIGIAACLLLALGIFFLSPRTTMQEEVFTSYYKPYPNIVMPTKMGSIPETSSSLRKEAYFAYDNKDFAAAEPLLEQIIKQGNDYDVLFYLGNTYLALGKASSARDAFTTILKNTSSDYRLKSQSEWYLGLSYLKTGDINNAISVLKDLEKDNTDYSKKARQVLQKLKE